MGKSINEEGKKKTFHLEFNFLFVVLAMLLFGPYTSVLYCAHICMKCFFGISNFLEEISSLSHSVAFLYFFAWLLRKAFLSLLAIFGILHSDGYIFPFLLCLSLLFFSQVFVRPPQTTILPFCISFSWGWFWSFLGERSTSRLYIVTSFI